MAHLDLTYFGPFQATLDKQPIKNFRGANVQGLLVYLSLQPARVIPRREIAELLWPGDPGALKNLRQTLLQLRKMLGDKNNSPQPFILTATKTLQFNQDSDFRLDVTEVRQALQHGNWEQVLVRCDKDFLPELVCESNDFETWLRNQRETFHQQVFDARSALTDQYLAAAEFAKAESYARQQLEISDWYEPAIKQLMHALAAQGRRIEAMALYEELSTWLRDEFGTVPSTEINALYDQIDKGIFDPPPPVQHATPFQAKAVPKYFVPRNVEISDILMLLTTNPTPESSARIAALVGMGGAGKTTLAANIAHALRGKFANGVLWANTSTSSAYDILEVWGRAYGYDFSGLSDLESRSTAVRGMLAERSVLLVLDNVEDAAHVRPLLPNSPTCACLVTTRNLDVASTINARSATIGELSAESGLQLLIGIVGEPRVRMERDAATEICQLLHNLPLAVEIAAQLLRSQPRRRLSSMATRLQSAQNRLDLNISDLAVRTSFEVSWDALDDEQKQIFALLTVFEGRPFSVDAIAYLADGDPLDVENQLYTLSSLSLLVDGGDQYFRQHPLLADFALEQLVQVDEAYARMVDYYLKFAEEKHEAYEALEPEWGNLNAAIEVAHRLERWERVVAFADFLEKTWQTRGRYSDARSAYKLAHSAAEQIDEDALLARVLLNWGVACVEQGDYQEADGLLTKSLHLAYDLEEGEPIADAQYQLGRVAMERGEYERSKKSLDECEEIRREIAEPLKLAETYYMQGWWFYENDLQLDEAKRLGLIALKIQRASGGITESIQTLQLLSQVTIEQENYKAASEYANEAETLCIKTQNQGELTIVYYLLAQISYRQKKYFRAKEQADSGLENARILGLRRIEGLLLNQLCVIQIERKDYQHASQLAQESIAIFEDIQDKLGYLYGLRNLGDSLYKLNKIKEANEIWLQAKSLASFMKQDFLFQKLVDRLDRGL